MLRSLPLGSIRDEATDISPPAPRALSADRANTKRNEAPEKSTLQAGASRPMFFVARRISEVIHERCPDDGTGMTLLQQDRTPIGTRTNDRMALEVDH
jgi:hypothetical protein